MTLSTKVAVLNDGSIQQLDTPENIYNHPANLFVAGFVGSPQMNLLTLPRRERHVILGDFPIPLPDSLVTLPSHAIMGIRPEHVRVANPDDPQAIQGQIFLVENLGMHNLVSIQVQNSNSEMPITPIRALLPADQSWSNEKISLTLSPQNMHWFDVDTGNSLLVNN
jgi:multiple sugar transport system ATP-binding protein